MCKYCEGSKSLFYDRNSLDVREVVVEPDGTISIFSNQFEYDEYKKNKSIGFSERESALMAQFSYSININYCPICGGKLEK